MLIASKLGPITRVEMARTTFGRPLYRVSSFLLGDTLIDSGCPHAAPELLAWCRERDVRRTVITHAHEDHFGGSSLLSGELGVETLAPAASAPPLAAAPRIPLYRRIVWGQPLPVDARPLLEEVAIGSYLLTVVPTPGHAPDHVCLFEPNERWLFAGDLYISAYTRYLRDDEDAWGLLASLKLVRALDPKLLICAHAGFVMRPAAALTRKITFLEELAGHAHELAERGVSASRIARRLLGREGMMRWVSGGEFSKLNLVRSLLHSRAG